MSGSAKALEVKNKVIINISGAGNLECVVLSRRVVEQIGVVTPVYEPCLVSHNGEEIKINPGTKWRFPPKH